MNPQRLLFVCFLICKQQLLKFLKACWYYRGCLFYLVWIMLLIFSWHCEYLTGGSLTEKYCPAIQCPSFLRANAILELMGSLGFSVGLIAVVYSFWDKRTLGLRYGDLVRYKFHSYHVCAIAHVFSIATCIVSAASGTSESALLSLIAVIYGLGYQSLAVYWTIWDSSKCVETAKKRYREMISHVLVDSDDEKISKLYRYLRKVSDTMLQPADRQYNAQIECFARTLVAYVVAENRNGQKDGRERLSRIIDVWTSVQHAPGPYDTPKDSTLFAVDVFTKMVNIGVDNDRNENKFCINYSETEVVWAWNEICCGFLACRLNELRMTLPERDVHMKLHQEISKILSILVQGEMVKYIRDAFTSLLACIMLSEFVSHVIPYNPQIIKMYKKNKLAESHTDIWTQREKYWKILCEELQFTIIVKPDTTENILNYAQKINTGV